jgi:hypothetical protein
MNRKEHIALWTHSILSTPKFPIIYMECIGAQELRGFTELDYLIGDVDFSAYKTEGLIIDSQGDLFELAFLEKEKFVGMVYPKKVRKRLTLVDVKEYLHIALIFADDKDSLSLFKSSTTVEVVVSQIAEQYSW